MNYGSCSDTTSLLSMANVVKNLNSLIPAHVFVGLALLISNTLSLQVAWSFAIL